MNCEHAGAQVRHLFRELCDEAGAECRESFGQILRRSDDIGAHGHPLRDHLRPVRLTRTCLALRTNGAPSNKIARAQIHRMLSRSIVSLVATAWLVDERLPVGAADDAIRLCDPELATGMPTAGLRTVDRGTVEEFGTMIGAIARRLECVGDRRATVAPTIQASNIAIGMLSPWFGLRRHGAAPERVADGMKRFLEIAAPDFVSAIDWPTAGPDGTADIVAERAPARPVRATCCLKYACASKRFCGTCPLRRIDAAGSAT
ncbi:hypothetical protein U0C82_16970 [Fulvimarina sp. 2208YS6-2-32]|uniref:Ferric siderophore reductase C-terminal domain-containing protein n=1 Tax=Fulvimarina uroteuthidis TaxID=3098149 RepID=A0ABU5I619_9HYPH|nr:hypothetical protein [Fulvimarina sp. 2208YS6-2-32]MDY8110833.1 hypothetical protein [Fulvimarina sp. 2208YS6-2-32]